MFGLFKKKPPQAIITMGPIIGKITTSDIRILIETNLVVNDLIVNLIPFSCCEDKILTLDEYLKSSENLQEFENFEKSTKSKLDSNLQKLQKLTTKITTQANKPTVFCIDIPKEDEKILFEVSSSNKKTKIKKVFYKLEFNNKQISNSKERYGIVKIFPEKFSRMKIACVANNNYCNVKKNLKGYDQWQLLKDDIDDMDIVIHCGNQIFSKGELCNPYDDCVSLLTSSFSSRSYSELSEQEKEQLKEKYRSVYRKNFNYQPTRKILSRCSNLMIWNDEEIRMDWGNDKNDLVKNSVNFTIGRIAREVYWEYERQLWDNVFSYDKEYKLEERNEGFLSIYGEIGFLFLDVRGGRSFAEGSGEIKIGDEGPSILGDQQFSGILKLFKKGGAFDTLKVLCIISPIPLGFFGPNLNKFIKTVIKKKSTLEEIEKKQKDEWCPSNINRKYREEQRDLIKLFHEWKIREKGREIIVLTGALNFPGSTSFLYKGKVIFKQLSCGGIVISKISKSDWETTDWLDPSIMTILFQLREDIGDDYTFEHNYFEKKANYGKLWIDLVEDKDKNIIPKIANAIIP